MSYSFTDPDFVEQRFARDRHVMDIFSGCGGLSFGLEMVCFKQHTIRISFEMNKHNTGRSQGIICSGTQCGCISDISKIPSGDNHLHWRRKSASAETEDG